ncbi:MAG: hypothetical protein K2K56_12790, partial [Lachnospiraceae bacterium]|nr:hypothetical protein [Lachnospiraceae bacterium]
MKKRVLSLLMIVSLLISMTGTAFATELASNGKETVTLRSKGALVYYEDDGKTESMVFEAADIKTLYDRVEELTEESINTKKAIIDAINDATGSEITDDVSFSDIADKIQNLTGQVKAVIDQLNKLDDFQGKNKIPEDASGEELAATIAKIGTKYDEVQDTNVSQNGASRFGGVLSAQAKEVLSGKMIYDGKTGAYIAGTMQDYSVSKKVIEYLTAADDTYVIKEGYYDGKIAVGVKGGSWKAAVNVDEYPGRKIVNRGVDAPNNGEVTINAREQLGGSFLLSEAIVTIPSFDRLSAIPQITLASAGVTEANSYDKDINGNSINYNGYIMPAGPENISTGKAAWVNGRLIVGTGQDNKSYLDLNASSGSGSESGSESETDTLSGTVDAAFVT